MSAMIDFLERMGKDATLRAASPAELECAMAHAGIGTDDTAAVLSGDEAALRASLAPGVFYSIQITPYNDDDPDENKDDENDGEDDEANPPPPAARVG